MQLFLHKTAVEVNEEAAESRSPVPLLVKLTAHSAVLRKSADCSAPSFVLFTCRSRRSGWTLLRLPSISKPSIQRRRTKIDMPFTGNLTIAVGDKLKDVEKAVEGIDVWPLLDLWANSFKIEAGFGRYMAPHYDATADGEAKDL
jgi:hypothetical protein